MPIFLHELVDVAPARGADYLDSVAEHHGRSSARLGREDGLVGLWTAIEVAGESPLAVNLWQVGGWGDLAANLSRQFDAAAQDPALEAWWFANVDLRRGGRDRLLESTRYTPDVARLRAEGVSGEIFLHQIVALRPGAAADYLDAFGASALPAMEAAGARFVGAYRVRLHAEEAIVLVAFASAADLARFQRAWHGEADASDLRRWRSREDEWVRGKETLLLRPRHFLASPWHRRARPCASSTLRREEGA